MLSVNDKYFQDCKSRMEADQAQTAHDWHVYEFEQMAKEMITKALAEHDQELQVNVETTLNGKPVSMRGLASDIKQLVYDSLRKAFK